MDNADADLDRRLAKIETAMELNRVLFEKFDKGFDRTTDVLIAMKEMLAIHETKIKQQDKTNDDVELKFRDFRQDLKNEFDQVRKEISIAMAKISNLELIKWVILGAGIVVATILSKNGFVIPHIPGF